MSKAPNRAWSMLEAGGDIGFVNRMTGVPTEVLLQMQRDMQRARAARTSRDPTGRTARVPAMRRTRGA